MLAYFDFLISEPQNVKSFEEIYISFPLGSRKIEILYFISMGRVIEKNKVIDIQSLCS